MSQNIQGLLSRLSQPLSFLLMGLFLYIIALFFGIIAKIVFGIQFVSWEGEQVDVTTYICFGSIDLILTVIQLFGSAILVILIWCYNFFIIDIIFQFPIVVNFFGNVPPISEDVILNIVNVIESIRLMLSYFTFETMSTASSTFEGVFTGE